MEQNSIRVFYTHNVEGDSYIFICPFIVIVYGDIENNVIEKNGGDVENKGIIEESYSNHVGQINICYTLLCYSNARPNRYI